MPDLNVKPTIGQRVVIQVNRNGAIDSYDGVVFETSRDDQARGFTIEAAPNQAIRRVSIRNNNQLPPVDIDEEVMTFPIQGAIGATYTWNNYNAPQQGGKKRRKKTNRKKNRRYSRRR